MKLEERLAQLATFGISSNIFDLDLQRPNAGIIAAIFDNNQGIEYIHGKSSQTVKSEDHRLYHVLVAELGKGRAAKVFHVGNSMKLERHYIIDYSLGKVYCFELPSREYLRL